MSRVGKKPVIIPAGVTPTINGQELRVKGPKTELVLTLHPNVHVAVQEGALQLTVDEEDNQRNRALWGLYRNLVQNMMDGVTTGFSKQLEVNGIGYRVAQSGSKLVLEVGFSHSVEFALPEGIEATVEKNIITIRGADKYLVGETAARIRRIREPEPYKGKGIKYVDEVIRRKAGKAAKGAAS
ncbi:MAG: 50S ribosomal protein L6 [bacterium]|nr:50S ribosomal protein L6 [bacterium]